MSPSWLCAFARDLALEISFLFFYRYSVFLQHLIIILQLYFFQIQKIKNGFPNSGFEIFSSDFGVRNSDTGVIYSDDGVFNSEFEVLKSYAGVIKSGFVLQKSGFEPFTPAFFASSPALRPELKARPSPKGEGVAEIEAKPSGWSSFWSLV
jgi:hypothetical protein